MTAAYTRAEQIALARLIGERLRAAREAAGMSQLEAARRLGYANSSKLSKIEKGRSSEVPTWAIKRAGWLYDVSIDYLMGECDNMAGLAGIPAPILNGVCRGLIRDTGRRRAEADALIDAARRLQRVRRLAGCVAPLADDLAEAQAIVEQEDAWQEVRGGSRMAGSSERVADLLRKAATL